MALVRTRPRTSLRPLPVRVRLTATFAVVVGIALALTGLLVYVQFRQSVDARIDDELGDRQTTLVALAGATPEPQRLVDLAGEQLLQVYAADGTVVASSRLLEGRRLVDAGEVRAARAAPVSVTRERLARFDDGARVRAFALPDGEVAAIGEPRDDRERALHRLAAILAITLPGALVIASLAGYLVTGAALRPVEAMRARAEEIGAGEVGQRLPEPGTRDELDRLATTLNDLLGRREQALEHERRIVGDASHELRTPVSVLLTRLDVALRRDLDADAAHEVLEAARGDARRLSRLADDLLLLARADQGALPLRREPVEVHDLLEEARERHAGAGGRRVVVAEEVAGGAVVLADGGRVAQVLDNLVVNALVHGAGDVELRARRDGEAEVAFSVRDHGAGYPQDFLPRAFERFSRADPARGRGGAGLGLAIVRAIADAHGGRAYVGEAGHAGGDVRLVIPASSGVPPVPLI